MGFECVDVHQSWETGRTEVWGELHKIFSYRVGVKKWVVYIEILYSSNVLCRKEEVKTCCPALSVCTSKCMGVCCGASRPGRQEKSTRNFPTGMLYLYRREGNVIFYLDTSDYSAASGISSTKDVLQLAPARASKKHNQSRW